MKLQDIKEMDKNDVLGLLGLETKSSGSRQLLGTLGTFGLGLLVGAGVALLLAPKSGNELRQDLRSKIRGQGNGVTAGDGEAVSGVEPASGRI